MTNVRPLHQNTEVEARAEELPRWQDLSPTSQLMAAVVVSAIAIPVGLGLAGVCVLVAAVAGVSWVLLLAGTLVRIPIYTVRKLFPRKRDPPAVARSDAETEAKIDTAGATNTRNV